MELELLRAICAVLLGHRTPEHYATLTKFMEETEPPTPPEQQPPAEQSTEETPSWQ